jgi:hypothetical protein
LSENTQYQRVKEITDQLEQGIQDLFNSEQYTSWLRTMSKFHDYSLNNTLLIAMQNPEATLVAGYSAWQKQFGRQVQKGEKAIRILAPTPYKKKVEMEKIDPATQRPVMDADGNPVTETVEVTHSAFKVVNVFDVSQTEGREIPTIGVDELTGDVREYEMFFEALKRTCPVPMDFEQINGGAKGYYHLMEQRIAIQEGMSQLQTIKTAIHEMAHQRLHAIDPDDKTKEKPQLTRNSKEVEAESVAYTICQHYGIDTSDYSFAYIAGWSHGKETPELKASLNTIRKAASEMINEIDGHVAEIRREQEAEKPLPSLAEIEQQQNSASDFIKTEMSPRQQEFMAELIERGFDVTYYWFSGEPHDLTQMRLSDEEVADIRYQAEVGGIPIMLYTPKQWNEIQLGIQDRVDVFVYAKPQFTAEQMSVLHRCLVAEKRGYLDRSDVEALANPDLSPEEMKEGMKQLRNMHKEAQTENLSESGLQENGLYRYYSTQRPITPGSYPNSDKPVNLVNFDTREPVADGQFQAWGYLEYEKPLTGKQRTDYELRAAPSIADRAVAPEAPAKRKKSVLADLHAKQEQVAGTKIPEPAQSKRKTKEMEQ